MSAAHASSKMSLSVSSQAMKPILEETSNLTTPECVEDALRAKSGSETPKRATNDADGISSGTPPYIKWASGFDFLLEDPEGQKVFQSYLRSEGALNNLMFWYAVNGFKTQSDRHKKLRLATVIAKTFLKRNSSNCLTEIATDDRKQILEAIRKSSTDDDLFDRAQFEIEAFLKDKAYPMFLKSDVYIEYCNKAIQCHSVSSDSPSNSGPPHGGLISENSPTSSSCSNRSTIVLSNNDPRLVSSNANASLNTSATNAANVMVDMNTSFSASDSKLNNPAVQLNDSTSVPLESPNISCSSDSNVFRPNDSSALATVHEDTELLCKEINLRGGNKGFEATSDTFATSSSPTCRCKKYSNSEGLANSLFCRIMPK